jgi:hypothetical protein
MAMDSSLPVFVGFKHSSLLKAAIMNCPPRLSKIVSPATSGLVDLQQVWTYHTQPSRRHKAENLKFKKLSGRVETFYTLC